MLSFGRQYPHSRFLCFPVIFVDGYGLDCSVPLKRDGLLVCGSNEGVLYTYIWGLWEDCSDRFPGHPESIETVVKVDEDTILTGSSDGLIRLVTVRQHRTRTTAPV